MNTQVVPIFFACDDNFVKYTLVSLTSIMENASKEFNYEVHILNTNISENIKQEILKLNDDNGNFKIDFSDVTKYLDSVADKFPVRDYYSKTTYFRMFIAEMYPEYDKAIYIDSDTVVLGDISEFYNHDLKECLVGACNEQAMLQEKLYGDYVEIVTGVNSRLYFNAGLLLINCRKFREEKILEQFIKLLDVYNFRVTQDEDYLNVLCKDRVFWIDNSWNVEIFGKIKYPEDKINMIHYMMWNKPWKVKDCTLSKYFWKYAEKTVFYKDILAFADSYTEEDKKRDMAQFEGMNVLVNEEINRKDSYWQLKIKDRNPERMAIVKKIEQYEKEGRFIEDVEEDPPSRMIEPDEVDYECKKLSSKIKASWAVRCARKFVNKMIKNNQFCIKEIIGTENLKNLESGAIMTCNHFNAFDSFAVHLAYEAGADTKKRKFFRVIREGNFTSYPGFYGFLMRNCRTLPLSSNHKTMHNFLTGIDNILRNGHIVLVYPEQSMWWNYRKPKPLQTGAFKFAVKSKVPVVPVFITMENSSTLDTDGFPVQEYTIHISKPIYPKEEKSSAENISYLMDENYKIWKEIYEKSYKTSLKYTCDVQ